MNWNELKKCDLKVFSTAWCPDCVVLKKLLKKQGVTFEEVDIDELPTAAIELKTATGETSIPWVKINDDFFVRGWHRGEPGSWSEKIFFEDIEANL